MSERPDFGEHGGLPASVGSPRHLSEDEYRGFLLASGAVTRATLGDYLVRRRRFVEAFPDLGDWLSASLPERLGYVADDSGGWRTTRRTKEGKLHYLARPYLYFLVLRGCLRFDLEWLVAARHIRLTGYLRPPELDTTIQTLTQEATDLGYVDWGAARATTWVLPRLYLHTGKSEVGSFGESDIEALKGALRSLGSRPDLQALYGSRESYHTALKTHLSQIYQASVSLYHRGQFAVLPQKNITRRDERPVLRPLMEAVADRYAKERSKDCRPSTAKGHGRELKAFVVWVAAVHPEVESFAEVDREMVLEYAEAMKEMILPRTGQPPAPSTRAHRLQTLSVFFRDTADWGWEDVPGIPLLSSGDYPKEVERVPRYIPEDELAKVMEAIRELECPYQRTALLTARWSGARRDEIRRLELDCLYTYRDGTPRLRIPARKTDRERFVPLNEEAARAVRELQEITRPGRGFVDPVTGYHVRYLFNSFGKPMSVSYLFDSSLMKVCAQVGL